MPFVWKQALGNNRYGFSSYWFDHKSLFINGSTFPIVPLTCNNCGNTYFINALVAKLIDPQEQSQNDNSKANEKELGDCNEWWDVRG